MRPGADSVKDKGQIAEFVSTRYVGEGKMTDDPYGMDGCIVVTEVPELQKLMKYICKNGFEHHVALVRADVAGVIEEALDSYLGWDLYVHE